ncbi:hypothetical protein ACFQ5J_10865 [Lacticaseibacillus baoqingensis]|uniref:DUF805 domain-containing protein n=1 Tax=Lacticaseibacillus baoqingensis TaxID=2486013 RepID=A0ABW4E797_9LACO|nr:hypothetical protein [Lacticaseibacillus baoqingensis]
MTDNERLIRAGNAHYGVRGKQAIWAYFANFVNYTGRSTRAECWWALLAVSGAIVVIAGGLLLAVFGSFQRLASGNSGELHGLRVVALLLLLAFAWAALCSLWPTVALLIRRSRDAGVPWWGTGLLAVLLLVSLWGRQWGVWANAGLALAAIGLLGISLLPSRPLPVMVAAPGWSPRVLTWVQVGSGLIGLVLFVATLMFPAGLWGFFGYLVWVGMVQAFSYSQLAANRRRLTLLWQLADTLGYGPKDIQQLAGRYGSLDWAATRPENLQFVPRQSVQLAVISQLQAKLAAQE